MKSKILISKLTLWLILICAAPQTVFCQEGNGPQEIRPSMPGGTVVAPTSTQEPSFIKILRNSEFASELEIVKDQADVLLPKLDLIRRSYEALQKDIFASQDKSPLERAQAIHDAHIAYSDELTKAVSECLLPHQVERLSQLAIRVERTSCRCEAVEASVVGCCSKSLTTRSRRQARLFDVCRLLTRPVWEGETRFYSSVNVFLSSESFCVFVCGSFFCLCRIV